MKNLLQKTITPLAIGTTMLALAGAVYASSNLTATGTYPETSCPVTKPCTFHGHGLDQSHHSMSEVVSVTSTGKYSGYLVDGTRTFTLSGTETNGSFTGMWVRRAGDVWLVGHMSETARSGHFSLTLSGANP